MTEPTKSALWSPYQTLEKARGNRNQIFENSGRDARAWGMKTTSGFGEYQHPEEIPFQLAFIGMPTVSYGYALDDMDLVKTRFPRAWGGVYEWLLDRDGNYRGAYVFTVVETLPLSYSATASEPNYHLIHSFQFNGLAFKALPERIGHDLT